MSDGPSPALYVYCIAFCCAEQANAPVAQRVIKEVSWRSMMGMPQPPFAPLFIEYYWHWHTCGATLHQ